MDSATDVPFHDDDPQFLGRFRYTAAGFIKNLILARANQEPDFVTPEMRGRWKLDELRKSSCGYSLQLAQQSRQRLFQKYMGYRDSIPSPENEDEDKVERLRENLATFVTADLDHAVRQAGQGKRIKWNELARWDLLAAIRDALDSLPEPSEDLSETVQPHRLADRLQVEIEGGHAQVTLDGRAFEVDFKGAKLVSALMEANGMPISASKLESVDKLDRVKKALPPPIRTLIKSQPGKGTWIELP